MKGLGSLHGSFGLVLHETQQQKCAETNQKWCCPHVAVVGEETTGSPAQGSFLCVQWTRFPKEYAGMPAS